MYTWYSKIFSLCYKTFLLNYMHIYFMLFCKMQICNETVFQEYFYVYTIFFNSNIAIWHYEAI